MLTQTAFELSFDDLGIAVAIVSVLGWILFEDSRSVGSTTHFLDAIAYRASRLPSQPTSHQHWTNFRPAAKPNLGASVCDVSEGAPTAHKWGADAG